MSKVFGGGSKPKTPESEKIITRHQAKLGKKGTALASRVGGKFVANINRDRKTRAKGTSSADVAVSQKRANESIKGDPIKVIQNASRGGTATAKSMVAAASGGVSERTRRQSAGNAQGLNISSSVTRAGLHIAANQNQRGIDKMNREFARANELVNLGGAVAGAAIQHDWGTPSTTEMSVANPSGAQMSAVVNSNDPFSNPLPNIDWSSSLPSSAQSSSLFAGGI